MNYEKYLIKKDKLDLLSSLKQINKKITRKMMKEYDLDSIEELQEHIIENFKFCLKTSKDDIFTRIYFQRLIENENSEFLSAYNSDIEGLWVFIYKKDNYYSYYVPSEIKTIIKKELNLK